MITVLQRVKSARVKIGEEVVGEIAAGMLVFLGVAKDDDAADCDYLVRKISQLRIFEDAQGKMNLSAPEAGAAFLVVSQFTLLGDCVKGRRPSFDRAAPPEPGERLYDLFVEKLRAQGMTVATGRFRAMMDVELINDGPVTLILESIKQRVTKDAGRRT